jgi:hypothetical protein
VPRRKQTEATAILEPESVTESTTEMSTETIEAPADKAKLIAVKGERKTGQELLDFAKANKDQPLDDVIYNAGYYTKKTNPETEEVKVTLHKPQFWAAISAASNPDLGFAPTKRAYSARAGRKPVVTVVKNGNIVVGSRHSTIAGFEPGAQVHVQSEAGRIILTPYMDEAGAAEEAEDDLDL